MSCTVRIFALVWKEVVTKTFSVPFATTGILTLLAFLSTAYGEGPTFEVASIKPSPSVQPGGMVRVGWNGGPGTNDPGRWTCENMSLLNLLLSAFDLKTFQLPTPPSGNDERFNITAKIPDGTTKEQFRQMQQNLLIDRFGLKFHGEKKEMQGYELVLAKNGPKFKESEPEPPKDPAANSQKPPTIPFKMTRGKDGFPVIPPGVNAMFMTPRRASGQWIRTTMEKFAETLSGQMGKPVTNSTGLEGKYDVSLQWAPDPIGNVSSPLSGMENNVPAASEPSGPNIFTALQEQLGLKLQPKKVTIEIFVIDHIEKTPTEN
ncbi:MAG: TIGR03435 family protein [Acidobacteriota bacterium]